MRLKIDPTHAESFAATLVQVANEAERGESVEIAPGGEGSGLVFIYLRGLGLDGGVRFMNTAFGSMKGA